MNFNLNGDEFKSQSVVIFNNGEAGKVENVSIKIEKRKVDEPDNAPDFKVIFTDNSNASVNLGIYYPNEQSTEGQTKMTVGKCLAIARSVLGDEYVFPEVKSTKEAVDACMSLTAKAQENAKVNVFVTYGTLGAPKKYIGVYKNFDFIESAGTVGSKLRRTNNPAPEKLQYNDLMERIVEDSEESTTTNSTSKAELDW